MAREVPFAVRPKRPSYEDDCCAEVTRVGQPPSSGTRREVLTRRVRLLVAATISYNVIEALVAIAAGAVTGSTALIGFGFRFGDRGQLRRGGRLAVPCPRSRTA
jgi:hypothetical protein